MSNLCLMRSFNVLKRRGFITWLMMREGGGVRPGNLEAWLEAVWES